MQHLMLRYTQTLITQLAQTAVCNRHHSVDQQLCRWLLLSIDRLPTSTVVTTQELIASMIGVRREGVTEAAGKLQKAGVIRYSRGRIEVLDRPRLESLSCECYNVVRRETERLLSPSMA
jgi:CRP-like cAMP-binding protein